MSNFILNIIKTLLKLKTKIPVENLTPQSQKVEVKILKKTKNKIQYVKNN